MIREKEAQTPTFMQCEVLVAGGGIAGISAALSAARAGADVLLLERGYMLGGLATAGLVTIFLPLCDGRGNQVSFGIAEELLRLSASMGAEKDYPDAWLGKADHEKRKTQRFQLQFNAQFFALLAEELLEKNGVRILYGAQLTAVQTEGNRVTAAIAEGKGGGIAIEARSYVDATGDADLFYFAGAETKRFVQGNILAAWYYRLIDGELELRINGACDVPDKFREKMDRPELLLDRRFGGLDAAELSEMMRFSHREILRDIRSTRLEHPDCVPVTLPTIPQVRMTRRIVGVCTLDDDQFDVDFEDSIGKIADWRRRGYVYQLPFGTLYGAQLRNLIAAGRCISVTDSMWDITRVIPACAVSGEAAGLAAAICDDFTKVDIRKLQNELAQRCAGGCKEGSAC